MSGRPARINGKFLGAPLNGVHRTAALYSRALLDGADAAGADIRIVTPPGGVAAARAERLAPRDAVGRPFAGGQLWENVSLPLATRGALLVNFCNLAPVLHPRYVVMIHDAQTLLYPGDYTGRQAAAYRALLPLVGRRARLVLTVSEFSKQCLAEHGIAPSERIEVVHNGTDHILDQAPDPDVLAANGLTGARYALVLGSTKRYKNIARALDLVRRERADGLRLVVAGGPPREAYERAGLEVPGGVVFTGFVSDGELRALYGGAHVFLFPSLTEGFGLPPVEAMHCGCPVIAARAGAMPEVCGNAARLVDPTSTEAWEDALAALASPEQRDDLIERGRLRAAELSWGAAGRRLRSVLTTLA